MKKKLPFVAASFILFILFVVFSYIVQKKYFVHVDFDTTVRLQNHIPHRLDVPFSILSFVGSFEPASLFLLILLFIWKKKSIFFVYPLFAGMHAFEIFGKVFVNHPSPPQMFLRTVFFANLPSGAVQLASSYPSGHSARALFMTTVASFIVYKTKKFSPVQKLVLYGALFAYDVIMLTSRVYLGEHWTSDVIGGSILGLSFGVFSFLFLYKKQKAE